MKLICGGCYQQVTSTIMTHIKEAHPELYKKLMERDNHIKAKVRK